MSTITTFPCEIIRKELQLVGQCITANYPEAFPDVAIKLQDEVLSKRSEILNKLNPDVLYSPFMCNGVVATYFACIEVSELKDVPSGMIGFKLPATKYAKVCCTNRSISEGYNCIFEWINTN